MTASYQKLPIANRNLISGSQLEVGELLWANVNSSVNLLGCYLATLPHPGSYTHVCVRNTSLEYPFLTKLKLILVLEHIQWWFWNLLRTHLLLNIHGKTTAISWHLIKCLTFLYWTFCRRTQMKPTSQYCWSAFIHAVVVGVCELLCLWHFYMLTNGSEWFHENIKK